MGHIFFAGIVSPSGGRFPLQGDCFPFGGIASPSGGLFPLRGDCFPFRGIVSPSGGKVPLRGDCFPFGGIASPSGGLFPLQGDCFPFKGDFTKARPGAKLYPHVLLFSTVFVNSQARFKFPQNFPPTPTPPDATTACQGRFFVIYHFPLPV